MLMLGMGIKMILYYGVTTYHLLCSIVHKLCLRPEESAVLYISDTHPDCYTLYKRISRSGVFSDVHLFGDKGKLRKAFGRYTKKNFKGALSPKILDKVTTDLCSETKAMLPHSLKNFKEIFIAGDHYLLGTYLVKNKISYNLFEEGSGLLSRPEVLIENVRRIFPLQLQLIKHVGTMGDNGNVKIKYANFKTQKEGFSCDKAVDFPVNKLLLEMDEFKINKVMDIFGSGRKSIDYKNTALLLTQQYVNFGFMSLDQQRLLYSLLIDYFCEDMKLFIKPHPSDVQAAYKEWFPEATVFERFMPSELLPLYMKKKFDLGLTACSTAIFGLSDYLYNIVSFTQQIENTFKSMHRYYITAKLIEFLFTFRNYGLIGIGINKEQLINLYKKHALNIELLNDGNELCTSRKARMIIIDDLNKTPKKNRKVCKKILNTLETEDVVIFINSVEDYVFADQDIEETKRFLTPVVIEKNRENAVIMQRENEFMFVYSKDIRVGRDIMDVKINKKLKNTKMDINVEVKKDMEIKMLEGILSATEAYLRDILEENKRLREKLEKLP